jgi:hypothetical protein
MSITQRNHRFDDDLYSKLEHMTEFPYTVTGHLHEAIKDYLIKLGDVSLDKIPSKPRRAAKRFTKPDVPELAKYFHERGSVTCNDDSQAFFDHFESNGWKVGGKGAMKCWKAAVRNWMRNKAKSYATNKRTSTHDQQSQAREQGAAIRANLSQCGDGLQVLGKDGADIRSQVVQPTRPDDGGQFVY